MNQEWPSTTFGELKPGDEFDIDGEAWCALAVDRQNNGTVYVWAKDSFGSHHTLEQSVDEKAYQIL
jgi:hypothetical protein